MRVYNDFGKILLQAKNILINVQYLISRMINENFWDQKHYDDEKPVKPTLSSKPNRQVVVLQNYNKSPSNFNFVTPYYDITGPARIVVIRKC